MTRNWKRFLLGTLVAGSVEGVTSLFVGTLTNNAHVTSALAVGFGIGASQLAIGAYRR